MTSAAPSDSLIAAQSLKKNVRALGVRNESASANLPTAPVGVGVTGAGGVAAGVGAADMALEGESGGLVDGANVDVHPAATATITISHIRLMTREGNSAAPPLSVRSEAERHADALPLVDEIERADGHEKDAGDHLHRSMMRNDPAHDSAAADGGQER